MEVLSIYDDIIKSPVGYLGVKFDKQKLSLLEFLGKKLPASLNITNKNSQLVSGIKVMLDQYFESASTHKQPDTHLMGTDFQKKVWDQLISIPTGETRTYGEIAIKLKSSPRAVGNACRKNPVPIFIPCHRVVSMSGRGGFMGHTQGEPMAIKEWLLSHEKAGL